MHQLDKTYDIIFLKSFNYVYRPISNQYKSSICQQHNLITSTHLNQYPRSWVLEEEGISEQSSQPAAMPILKYLGRAKHKNIHQRLLCTICDIQRYYLTGSKTVKVNLRTVFLYKPLSINKQS